jgi:hypothetical protein
MSTQTCVKEVNEEKCSVESLDVLVIVHEVLSILGSIYHQMLVPR